MACSCDQLPLSEVYNKITDIVEVKVVKIEGDGTLGNNIIVEVMNVFKGEYSSEQLTILTTTNSCGIGLTLGNSYIIYDEINSNQLDISMCSRITCSRTIEMENSEKRTEEAETELEIIRKIESQKNEINDNSQDGEIYYFDMRKHGCGQLYYIKTQNDTIKVDDLLNLKLILKEIPVEVQFSILGDDRCGAKTLSFIKRK